MHPPISIHACFSPNRPVAIKYLMLYQQICESWNVRASSSSFFPLSAGSVCVWLGAWVCVREPVRACRGASHSVSGIRSAFEKRERERERERAWILHQRFSFFLLSLCCPLLQTCMNANGPLSVTDDQWMNYQSRWPRDTIPVSFVVV